jgi:diguanylate cyclase (GGDEF)-like protein
MRVPALLPGRVRRRLLLLTLVAAAVGSASLALVTAVLVLGFTSRQAEQSAQRLERDFTASLTSFQPIYDVQRRMQLEAAAGQLQHALVVDQHGRVIAASNQALVGESLLVLASLANARSPLHFLDHCGLRALGLACLDRRSSHFQGPLPWVGGEHLVRFTPVPLALAGSGTLPQHGTLITELDLQPLLQQAGLLALQVFALGLVPLTLTCACLVLVVRQRLFPELLNLAQTDALSGVMNRRAFLEAVAYRLEQVAGTAQPAVVALIDVDHFKQVNDTFGHAAGDEVIRAIAAVLEHGVRRSDLVGRLGGDEFALWLEVSAPQARQLLERLRSRVAGQPIVLADGQRLPITLSIGMATSGGRFGNRLQELLAAADASLYVAKDQGRNRVVDLERQPPEGWQVRTA